MLGDSMSTKIIQLDLFQREKSFEDVAISSIKALFAGHNEINKRSKEIKSYHDFLLFHILETQDAMLALSERIDRMEQSEFTIKSP
jgi:hypothetical protein